MRTFGTPLIYLFALGCAITGCAKVNTFSATSPGLTVQHQTGLAQVAVGPVTIQGVWKTGCNSPSKESHSITKILFQGTSMTTITTSYADPDCKFSVAKETRYSEFEIDDASDATLVTDDLKVLLYVPLNDVTTTQYNRTKFCGVTNWATKVQTSFTSPTSFTACAVDVKTIHHTQLFGSTELYLDGCTTDDETGCTATRYTRTSGTNE